ncbi:hypothetical protein [Pandoravirus japonicus]|uniref:Uncharacterized protein n=1 Tax=Pandoravirus japonicus TaxID=2823154 RepID=A0A811BQC5_9VIRU|nr:hypothetical protein [Pandoravirus japonicus]
MARRPRQHSSGVASAGRSGTMRHLEVTWRMIGMWSRKMETCAAAASSIPLTLPIRPRCSTQDAPSFSP